MIIAYDVSHIRLQRAGLGRLAAIQLQGLLNWEARHTYVLHGWAPDLDIERIRSLAGSKVRISVAKVPGVFKRIYWNYLRMPSIETFIGRFDVFHCSEPLLPPVGKRKSIVSFNDCAYYKFPHFYSKTTAKKWDYLYRRTLRRADFITVLSESTRLDLVEIMKIPPEKVHVVHPPTDPVFTNATSPDDKRLLARLKLPDQFALFVGTLEPRKNIPRLVRAFEMFCENVGNKLSLVIVGRRGWLYEDILASLHRSSVRERILLLDYVADEALAALYRMATMLVFPSLYEGHGYPVVEAMTSGTPVITSNNSSLKEIGEGAALLVDAEDVMQIYGAMKRLFEDRDLRRELSECGLERSKRYSLQNAVDAILHVYDKLERA